uniref:Uncharacterized protein n=1 Tax=Caenorhabditis tropicalis TaxID=1561998 RepID=A0A1I7UC91_9PELO
MSGKAIQNVTVHVFDTDNEQINGGLSVLTNHVEETVHAFMIIILVVIILFLVAHIFIRFHYKAKTEYALNELRDKFEKNSKGPSAFALPKDQKTTGESPPKPVEILMDPEQLAPMVHHVALAPPMPVEEPLKNICYMPLP